MFAKPPDHVNPADCYWYHTLDLPGHGRIQGDWTLSNVLPEYLGGVNFAAKRVLEIGPASGLLTVTMEKAGADVVSYDLSPDVPGDNAIQPGTREAYLGGYRAFQQRLNNSYWLTHQSHRLRARVVHGTVYQLPADLGPFDIGTFGCVLLHLRDPFRALHNVARLARERIIIVERFPGRLTYWKTALCRRIIQFPLGGLHGPTPPVPAYFLPANDGSHHHATWWYLLPDVLTRWLDFLGFEIERKLVHEQVFEGRPQRLVTLVGRRVREGYELLDR